MVDTAFFVVPPTSRFASVEIGTMAWSSRLVVASEPAVANTPTTVNSMLFAVNVWPTTSVLPNNSVAVEEPSTATAACSALSASVMKRPLESVRDRTGNQDGVVPTTDVVQLVDPLVSESDVVLTPATAPMSGAATFDARAAASSVVRGEAGPKR